MDSTRKFRGGGVSSTLVDSILASSRFGPQLMEKFKLKDKSTLSSVWWAVTHNRRKEEDVVPDPCTPQCMAWSVDRVASWLRCVGFAKYVNVFRANCIDGKKLMWVNASKLAMMGIHDFNHIKSLTAAIKFIVNNYEEDTNPSIALPPQGVRTTFLRQKSRLTPQKNPIVYKCYLRKEGYDGTAGCTAERLMPRSTRCCIFAPKGVEVNTRGKPPPAIQLCSRCLKKQKEEMMNKTNRK